MIFVKNTLVRARSVLISQVKVQVWQCCIAALLVIAMGGAIFCYGKAEQHRQEERLQAMSSVDAGQISDYLHAALGEWTNPDGQYAWITNPLRAHGATPEDLARVCEILDHPGGMVASSEVPIA